MKRLILIFAVFMVAVSSHPHTGEAASLKEIFLFRATVEADDGTYHWEYNSPDDFEYHAKGKVVHGTEAEGQVKEIYEQADLFEEVNKEALAKAFQQAGYEDMTRLDVRWQNGNGDLYTWLWEKKQQ
ncbi:hypothetical protein D7Z54_13075 [Salibacterium salarium]|uniref:Uncharacterized protein n=1 Tax=Salibacterium salarium TaxID=284579 RepID=A0A3R9P7F7_9BACI|nr:hypothetical protein [Salibacterium salarium]RSL32950.1 hypothetical protein D7Z54_13075 [Salibacterium salarium]